MTMTGLPQALVLDGYDATSLDLWATPHDLQLAGYLTGSPDIRWTPAQLAAYPEAILLDQAPDITDLDVTADGLDVERYAGTDAEAPSWLLQARYARKAGRRPGQRDPGFYRSLDGLDSLAASLAAAGITSGVPLWLAHWGIGRPAAVRLLGTVRGPFVLVGVQYDHGPRYDTDVWLADWVDNVARPEGPPPVRRWQEQMMRALPQITEGAAGQHVRDVQALCNTHGHALAVDGVFGPRTSDAVRELQHRVGVTADGIVGPATWPVLLDVE